MKFGVHSDVLLDLLVCSALLYSLSQFPIHKL